MFYLLKRDDERKCEIGERCMLLADFSGVFAGTRGRCVEVYKEGVMIEWDRFEDEAFLNVTPLRDGFARDELEYLAWETKKHPRIDPTVTAEADF